MATLAAAVIWDYRRRVKNIADESEHRLVYIRTLIDSVYTFYRNPEKLLLRMKTEMTADKLLLYGVVRSKCTEACDPAFKVNDDEKLFYQLSLEGFSSRELCVLFKLNSLSSVYVKRHRINKKLGRASRLVDFVESDEVHDDNKKGAKNAVLPCRDELLAVDAPEVAECNDAADAEKRKITVEA